MAINITTINYSDINMTIFEDCFNDSLSYLDATPPNVVWEEFGLTSGSSEALKLDAFKTDLQISNRILYKTDIDGYIVEYACGVLEHLPPQRYCALSSLMRRDSGGSRAWSYTSEYCEKLDAYYKSLSSNEPTSSLWVVAGSSMEDAYNTCVSEGWLTYTVGETKSDYHGQTYKKLIVTFS